MNHTTDRLLRDFNLASSPRLCTTARPVLFAAYHWGRPTAALRRAHALARALRGQLHVLRVLPAAMRTNILFPQDNLLEAISLSNATWTTVEATRAWCGEVLPDRLPAGNIHVMAGGFAWGLIKLAEQLDCQLLVLPPVEGEDGSRVAKLARSSATPILVARAPAPHDTIIAGTDLGDARFPVLRQATDLARCLDAPLVFVHNVEKATAGVTPSNMALLTKAELLRAAASRVEPEATAVVSNRADAAAGVLAEARDREADIVVVGARPRSWFDRLWRGGVAAKVVETAKRSVLVTPMIAIRDFAR